MAWYATVLKFTLFSLLFVLCESTGTISDHNVTFAEIDLHRKLFELYNPDIMPVRNRSESLEVTAILYIMSIDNIDERSQTFTMRGFMEYKWRDEFLTWNPEDYGGITKINVKNDNIWLPDLALMNVYDNPTELGQRDGRTSVYHDGISITWPYKMYQVGCKIRIRYFPFDVQHCELDFLSWTNPVSVLKLKTTETLSMFYFKESAEWALSSYEVSHFRKPFGEDFWDHLLFKFTLQRKWLFQVLNILAPIVFISILNLLCFVTPADCGEKISLCISIFLTLAVFITIISDSLPESSDEASLFGIYVGLQFFGSGLTVLATVVSLYLNHKSEEEPVAACYRLLVRVFCHYKAKDRGDACRNSNGFTVSKSEIPAVASMRELGIYTVSTDEPLAASSENSSTDLTVTWKSVSRAFDHMCLLLSVMFNVALTIGLVYAFYN